MSHRQRSVRRVAGLLLLGLLLVVAGGAALGWQQGYRLYAVRTGSMSPTYPTGSVVLETPVHGRPQVGDVVTFPTTDGVVTHRVATVTPVGLKTKGDANRSRDPWTVPSDHVTGRVVAGLPRGGYALVFLKQPTGVPALMVLTTSIALAWSLFFGASAQAMTGRAAGERSRQRELEAAASRVRIRRSASAGVHGTAPSAT